MRLRVLLILPIAVAGCSRPAPSTGQGAAATAPVPGAASGASCGHSSIDRADVQPLLSGPITSVKPAPSDADSCVFSTAGFSSITVTVRPNGGKQTLTSWRKGPVTPVPGVGDAAVWEPDLNELVAARGDTLCTVTAMGPQAAPATAQTEGGLCGKIFAGL